MDRLPDVQVISMLSLHSRIVFDRIVQTSKKLFRCKSSFITVIDKVNNRQIFLSEAGLAKDISVAGETSLELSFCQYVVSSGKPFIINDTRCDDLTKNHPAIEKFKITSYLGVPVMGRRDEAAAVLCVTDNKVRNWDADDLHILKVLSDGLSRQLIPVDIDLQFQIPAIKWSSHEYGRMR